MTRTDTLYERLLEENPGNLIHLEEMLHHARQMERKLDEAREATIEESTLVKHLQREREEDAEERAMLAAELEKCKAERDRFMQFSQESSKGVNRISQANQYLIRELIASRNERDEAREIARDLIDIACHCLGWHDNRDPQRITNVIQRWNTK